MLTYIRSLRRGDEGASAVEYGLLIAAIAAVIVVVAFALGHVVKDAFQSTCDNFKGQMQSDQTCSQNK